MDSWRKSPGPTWSVLKEPSNSSLASSEVASSEDEREIRKRPPVKRKSVAGSSTLPSKKLKLSGPRDVNTSTSGTHAGPSSKPTASSSSAPGRTLTAKPKPILQLARDARAARKSSPDSTSSEDELQTIAAGTSKKTPIRPQISAKSPAVKISKPRNSGSTSSPEKPKANGNLLKTGNSAKSKASTQNAPVASTSASSAKKSTPAARPPASASACTNRDSTTANTPFASTCSAKKAIPSIRPSASPPSMNQGFNPTASATSAANKSTTTIRPTVTPPPNRDFNPFGPGKKKDANASKDSAKKKKNLLSAKKDRPNLTQWASAPVRRTQPSDDDSDIVIIASDENALKKNKKKQDIATSRKFQKPAQKVLKKSNTAPAEVYVVSSGDDDEDIVMVSYTIDITGDGPIAGPSKSRKKPLGKQRNASQSYSQSSRRKSGLQESPIEITDSNDELVPAPPKKRSRVPVSASMFNSGVEEIQVSTTVKRPSKMPATRQELVLDSEREMEIPNDPVVLRQDTPEPEPEHDMFMHIEPEVVQQPYRANTVEMDIPEHDAPDSRAPSLPFALSRSKSLRNELEEEMVVPEVDGAQSTFAQEESVVPGEGSLRKSLKPSVTVLFKHEQSEKNDSDAEPPAAPADVPTRNELEEITVANKQSKEASSKSPTPPPFVLKESAGGVGATEIEKSQAGENITVRETSHALLVGEDIEMHGHDDEELVPEISKAAQDAIAIHQIPEALSVQEDIEMPGNTSDEEEPPIPAEAKGKWKAVAPVDEQEEPPIPTEAKGKGKAAPENEEQDEDEISQELLGLWREPSISSLPELEISGQYQSTQNLEDAVQIALPSSPDANDDREDTTESTPAAEIVTSPVEVLSATDVTPVEEPTLLDDNARGVGAQSTSETPAVASISGPLVNSTKPVDVQVPSIKPVSASGRAIPPPRPISNSRLDVTGIRASLGLPPEPIPTSLSNGISASDTIDNRQVTSIKRLPAVLYNPQRSKPIAVSFPRNTDLSPQDQLRQITKRAFLKANQKPAPLDVTSTAEVFVSSVASAAPGAANIEEDTDDDELLQYVPASVVAVTTTESTNDTVNAQLVVPMARVSVGMDAMENFSRDPTADAPLDTPTDSEISLVEEEDDGARFGCIRVSSWSTLKKDKPYFQPVVHWSRDLPHNMQDYINIMDPYFRNMQQMTQVFEAYIAEATAYDESPEVPPIRIINEIDDEPCPPWEFHYSNHLWHSDDVPPPDVTKLHSCECIGPCKPDVNSCACVKRQRKMTRKYSIPNFVYDENGLLLGPDLPIFECNDLCRCSDDCMNRVVQKGRKKNINIAKTRNKGWGVFAGELIPKGSFVGLYAGELLTENDAETRGLVYNKLLRTYLFDLDFYFLKNEEERLTVDAYHVGNFTRFLNHSCDPNCALNACYINESNVAKPFLAIFAQHDIQPNEELCFSYHGYDIDTIKKKKKELERKGAANNVNGKCECGAEHCVGRMFVDID